MLRVAAKRLSSLSLPSPWRPNQAASVLLHCDLFFNVGYSSSSDQPRSDGIVYSPPFSKPGLFNIPLRGFAFESLTPTKENNIVLDVPTTVATVMNPTSKIVYDEYNHEHFPLSDLSKQAFAYFVLTCGRFVYASLIRLLILKFVLSMPASKEVLALASLEVDLSSIELGSTMTVKWRGKPVFIRRQTEDDIKLANSVDVRALRDPQPNSERVKNLEWLIFIGVCSHLGCIPLPNDGDFGGWFCPCHGSHYDISGKICKGPSPYNLEVPTYTFFEENKLMIV